MKTKFYDLEKQVLEKLEQKNYRETVGSTLEILDEMGMLAKPVEAGVKPAICDTKPIIELLMNSFNKAQKYIDEKQFESLKFACTELLISNAEARQALSKLSV